MVNIAEYVGNRELRDYFALGTLSDADLRSAERASRVTYDLNWMALRIERTKRILNAIDRREPRPSLTARRENLEANLDFWRRQRRYYEREASMRILTPEQREIRLNQELAERAIYDRGAYQDEAEFWEDCGD